MATLRATQFSAGTFSDASDHTVYTVPTGHKIILKFVQVVNFTSSTFVVNVKLVGMGTVLSFPLAAFGAAGGAPGKECWMVFEPGQALSVGANIAHAYGYQLNGSLMTI